MRILLLSYHKVVVWSRIHFCFVQYLKIFKWKLLGKCKNTILCRNEVRVLCVIAKGTWLNSVCLILEKGDLGFKYQSALIEAFIEVTEAVQGPGRDQIKCFLAKAFLKEEEFLVKTTIIPRRSASHSFFKAIPLWTHTVCRCAIPWAVVSSILVFRLSSGYVIAWNLSSFYSPDALSNLPVKMIWFVRLSFFLPFPSWFLG